MFRLVLVFIFAVATTIHGRNVQFPLTSVGGKIVECDSTTIEDYYPYQISLESQNIYYCGGSLIRPNVVLIAAHCINFPPNFYSVRAGSSILIEGGQVAQVTDVCSHPKYNKILMNNDYDVAVLKLNKPLILNSAVQLINFQNVSEEIPVNTMATVTGWGYWQFGLHFPTNLQKVQVSKVDQKKCQDIFWNLNRSNITDRMTCYGNAEGGNNVCEGVHSGPLVASGKQIGILLWGAGCTSPNVPAVFTSLENEEIQQHINKCLAKFA